MEAENSIDIPGSRDSGWESEKNDLQNTNCDSNEAVSQFGNCDVREDKMDLVKLGQSEADAGNGDSKVLVGINTDNDLVDNHELLSANCDEAVSQFCDSDVREGKMNQENLGRSEADVGNGVSKVILGLNTDKNLVGNASVMQGSIALTEMVTAPENFNSCNSTVCIENGTPPAQAETPARNCKINDSPITGVKRARIAYDEHQSSVRVMYNSLTRASKQKLEELLQQWSRWHAQHCSSTHNESEVLESGEGTYFPALQVGLDKPSAVSFWIDNHTRKLENEELVSMDNDSVPFYDRGYALGLTSEHSSNLQGGMELIDASRCFNCGSYNHSLKECPKPRNNVAVNNARKQHKSRRNQNAGARNPTRYYQNSSGGKYGGLRPGVLDTETRELLGLRELDPPPWLNRMREIGYPPGYLDPEDEDQPSGIMIFGDEDDREEKEDGEILDTDYPEPKRKMSVEFPGINAPVPENADESRWRTGASSTDPHRRRSHHRFNHSLEPNSRDYYNDERGSRDFRDDGPPGCEPGSSSLSSYLPRYDDYDSRYYSHSSRGPIPIPRSPSFRRSFSEKVKSPLAHENSPSHGSHSSISHPSPSRMPSTQNNGSGSASYENFNDESRYESVLDSASHSKERRYSHRYHSRR